MTDRHWSQTTAADLAPLPRAANGIPDRAQAHHRFRSSKPPPEHAHVTEPPPTFQEIVFKLKQYWSDRGCIVQEPFDVEVGAGTSCPETFLRALGPEALPHRLRAAQPPAGGRPLRRQSESPLQAHAASGDPEADARRRDRTIHGQPRGHRHRSPQARPETGRRQLGESIARRMGRRLAGDARWPRNHPVHLFSAVSAASIWNWFPPKSLMVWSA